MYILIMIFLLFVLFVFTLLMLCFKKGKNKHVKIEGKINTPIISGEIKLDIDNTNIKSP